jgi:lipoprotein-anchoring transpeptidase ErfK/SrfK
MRRTLAASALIIAVAVTGCSHPKKPPVAEAPAPVTTSGSSTPEAIPAAQVAPAGLKTIDYSPAPKGFPADPDPNSATPLTEALHPTTKLTVADAPGGKPIAFLAPTLSGVTVVVPIVQRKPGWVAVLVPSVNRSIGWIPDGGWETVQLKDQLVVKRSAHSLSWYRDGQLKQSWTVTVGAAATPTPLGRTFVLGRSAVQGAVYAGLDAFALGAMPDDPNSVSTGLKGAHTGIHAWYKDDFGKNKSNGCVRMPKAAQQLLLNEVGSGTEVVVLD